MRSFSGSSDGGFCCCECQTCKLLTLVRTLKTAHEANRRRAKPKADAKGGDLFDAFSKTQNDASSLIDEFKRRCEERSASRDG